ncbi:hypothetical protein WH357_21185 [Enterobacter ludwigii]
MKTSVTINKFILTALIKCWSEWPIRINISYADFGVLYPENYFFMLESSPEIVAYHLNYELLETTLEILQAKGAISFSAKRNEIIYDISLTVDIHNKLSLVIEHDSQCQSLASFIRSALNHSSPDMLADTIELLKNVDIDILPSSN